MATKSGGDETDNKSVKGMQKAFKVKNKGRKIEGASVDSKARKLVFGEPAGGMSKELRGSLALAGKL